MAGSLMRLRLHLIFVRLGLRLTRLGSNFSSIVRVLCVEKNLLLRLRIRPSLFETSRPLLADVRRDKRAPSLEHRFLKQLVILGPPHSMTADATSIALPRRLMQSWLCTKIKVDIRHTRSMSPTAS